MDKTENKSELIKLIIVYAVDLAIMIGLSYALPNLAPNMPIIAKAALIYILLLVPVIVYAIKKGDCTAEAFGFRKIKVSTFFFTILLSIVSAPMYMFANVLSQLVVPNVLIQNMDNLMGDSMGASFIAMAVFAPIAEEIICRGFFTNRLKKTVPFAAAAVISAVMFGLLHLNINQFCYTLVLGIIFAYVNKASGSIFTSIIMHFLVNASNIGIVLLAQKTLQNMGMDLAETAETSRQNAGAMIFAVVFYGILAIISFFLSRKVIRAIAKREGNE
ncbi:CPBP family intramembrane metalloprotease [Butyrivibrio fibrisolvens]|uniref:CPBP family intramembrane glutamic endopeptidase n=1 Tax=Pseudobutyrivibrio ruminis TaxID=46206 RepID=UPI0004165192|nr:type II CAAX endopeptidase family protein [Pseudobutyrivibrio ruminis]MDC7278984.1 CPBP family intramembrane metalloprotease [Butyrivibrio fibrisolvens]